jgi:hypothetical protein
MPTDRQILGAKVRAAREAYEKKHGKPSGGGLLIPSRAVVYDHLSKKFGIPPYELSFFFTYSRACTHKWSEGACDQCPK